MSPTEIARLRLNNLGIESNSFKIPVEIVTHLGAVQAQEYAQSKWSLGLRSQQLKDSDVEKSFTKGEILRTHLLRPTWHFVTAKDIRWLLMLTAPRVNAISAYMYRQVELDNKVFSKTNKVLVKCLRDGKHLTRKTINEEFRKNKIIAQGHRLSYIMMKAELEGIICSGPRDGNQFTYALLEERVPTVKRKNKTEALVELAKRYFKSRGPATLYDFSTWSGLTLADCRKGLENGKDQFATVHVGKHDYYYAESSSGDLKSDRIHLLPVYDEFIMGYKNRDSILVYSNSLKQKSTFSFDSTIVLDGQIIGTWKRIIGKNEIDIKYDFFKPLSKKQKSSFAESVGRFELFTGLKVNY